MDAHANDTSTSLVEKCKALRDPYREEKNKANDGSGIRTHALSD